MTVSMIGLRCRRCRLRWAATTAAVAAHGLRCPYCGKAAGEVETQAFPRAVEAIENAERRRVHRQHASAA